MNETVLEALSRSHVTVRAFELAGVDQALAGALESAEHERAATLLDAVTRRDFLAGRITQRLMAAELLSVPPQELRIAYHCPDCGLNPVPSHGRPGYQLHGLHSSLTISLSRSHGWGVAAMVPGAGQALGIDVQKISQVSFAGFDDVALSPTERKRLALIAPGAQNDWRATAWARKEALAKHSGLGLRTDPTLIPAFPEDQLPERGSQPVMLWDLAPADLGMPAGFAVAVAFSESLLSADATESAHL
ncbi:4-phosphopantetheinyl transferase [Arthrobacter psychrolactophilus]|uniref:4-phosphopantetheinyl transferase n=1 Tax=Arthrobacter psychrolactophilus TaxID=92442 RepID=A0A2V5IL30_9MICC|nr:4'-phosphopantetheinyl transferase superfamily protein [Arthrobacter psychrolactophilus]PYI37368.1 4-phosphopantetheinyl transferase [Arthrobacter psychrolactophilus]